ncbi:MAG TPA: hypothetical protein VMF55_09990 [Solirubrobacterales bacterium]|nr:hypothetical protein [Solirubrobacterales bacterium]
MRRSARNSVGVAVATALAALLVGAFGASPASAIEITNFEAGTCTTDGTTLVPNPATECNYSSPSSSMYTQAAGHPNFGITDFSAGVSGGNQVKRVHVELPKGLNVNPQAAAQCPVATFQADGCGASSEVGTSFVTSSVLPGVQTPFPVYDLVPNEGEPGLFAFHVSLLGGVISEFVYLETQIEWAGDYHESFSINNIAAFPPLGRNRLVFDGRAGNGSFLTLPSPCNGDSTSFLTLESGNGEVTPNTPTTPPVPISGCASVPFKPAVGAVADGPTDSSVPVAVTLDIPQHAGGAELNSSTVRTANVTLPAYTGLNPATAPGLKFCPDSSFPLHSRAPTSCPAESQIGTIAIEAPELPPGSLSGPVYLATQKSREPLSGQEYRVFFNAESARYGVQVREEGQIRANPTTGQITGEFAELPQVAFSSATLTFGPQAKHAIPVLSSPPLCTNTSTSSAVPYSTEVATATAPTELKLTQAPGGAPCAKTMAERPFKPGFTAKPGTSKVATYTPYTLNITRDEGQQEVKGFDVTLPPGATAKLAGIPYCQPKEYEAALGRSGAEQQKNSACGAKSEIGVATIQAGTGASPLSIDGKVYLAGPYKGAPLSVVVITPAVAGPFDLGNVVVRAPLGLDPETGQASTSAEIPDVFGGVKLDIRSIVVNLNRKEFTLNGTNCAAAAVTGAVRGGGGDPTNPAAWSAVNVSFPFQSEGCKGLGFKPKLKLRLFGQTHRAQHPKLKATLTTKAGQANTALASVALPHAIFLDQSSLGTVCTRPQFAAEQCPKKSVYGHARAWSPLLSNPLEGKVVLRSSNNTLPDMVAALKGQVNIDLDGRIDSFKGGIRTTFAKIPDLPVSKFVIVLPGGKHGLLQASTNLCAKPVKGIIRLTGQNGKKANRHVRIQTPCKKSKKGKKSKKHKGSGGKKRHGGKKQKGKRD